MAEDLEELKKRLDEMEKRYKELESEKDTHNKLRELTEKMRQIFFQEPETKEEYKTWKENFLKANEDYVEYIDSIAEPLEDEENEKEEIFDVIDELKKEEDSKFLLKVIGYCFSVKPRSIEEAECLMSMCGTALTNIAKKLNCDI